MAAGGPLESSTIVIDAVPTADAAGLYIAQDEGLFAKQGLKVKIAPINGGEYGMGDLQTGKAELIEGNYVSFVLAQVAGKFAAPDPNNPTGPSQPVKPIDMRIIADSSQMQPGNQGLYVMPGTRFKTVANIAHDHATVGVNTLHNIGSVLLGSLLTANGFNPGSVTQTPEPLPFMPMLLSQHKIETAWLPEPFGTEAQEKYGAVEIADFDQGSLQNFPIGTIVGSAQWVKSNPDTIAAFLRAYDQGQQIADTNRSTVEKALVKWTPGVAAHRREHDARHVPAGHGRPRHAARPRRDVPVRRAQAALQDHEHDPARARRDRRLVTSIRGDSGISRLPGNVDIYHKR